MRRQEEAFKDANWDYLIGLDACRADTFEQLNNIKGEYERVESPACDTIAWYKKVFPDKYDIKLYSASPWLSSKYDIGGYFAGEHFKQVIDVWDERWDNNVNTTPPRELYKAAKMAKPGSIIWFEQPHFPPVSDKDKDLWCLNNKGKTESGRYLVNQIFRGKLKEDRVREAYRNNLEEALIWVQKLVERLEGRKLITADHGELLGEAYAKGKIGWMHGEEDFGDYRPRQLMEVPFLKTGE